MVSEQGRWGKNFLIIFIFENLEKQVQRIRRPRNKIIVAFGLYQILNEICSSYVKTYASSKAWIMPDAGNQGTKRCF